MAAEDQGHVGFQPNQCTVPTRCISEAGKQEVKCRPHLTCVIELIGWDGLSMMIPPERTWMLQRVCKALRAALAQMNLPAAVHATQNGDGAQVDFEERLDGIVRRSRICSLCIRSWRLGPRFVSMLVGQLSLSRLDLSDANSYACSDEIVSLLVEALAHCPSLTHLHLRRNRICDESAARIAEVLVQCPRLTHLDLSSNKISYAGAARIAEYLNMFTALAALDLSGNRINAQGARKLANGLQQCPSLIRLDLRCSRLFCRCSDDPFRCLCANALMAPAHDSVSQDELDGSLVSSPFLICLNLAGCGIPRRNAGIIARELGRCESLVHLNLTGNNFRARELAGSLGGCEKLTYLGLGYNHLGEELGGLIKSLRQCRSLAHLDLRGNKIGDAGADSISDELGQTSYSALTRLDLSYNEIGDGGACRLAGVLGECPALETLSLACNMVRPLGARRLASVVLSARCPSLAHLNLQGNPCVFQHPFNTPSFVLASKRHK